MRLSTLLCSPLLAVALTGAASATAPVIAPATAVPGADAQAVTAYRLAEHAATTAPRLVVKPRVASPARQVARTEPRPVRHRVHVRRRPARHVAPAMSPVDLGRAAFASLHTPLPAGWAIRFQPYQGSYQGLSSTDTRTVIIWVRRSDSRQELRITIAHELGHVLDFTTLTEADQHRFLELRGRSGFRGPWYPENGTSDYASPAGDFAEVYALWLAGPGDFRSTFAARPSSSQLAQVGQLFQELRARQR